MIEGVDVNQIIQENERLRELAFSRLSEAVTFPRLCRLVYVIYPDFFLRGVEVKGVKLVVDDKGILSENSTHYPSIYSPNLLVQLLQKISKLYEFVIGPGLVGMFLSEIQIDMSPDYMMNFPYVLRIVTGNEFKRREYEYGFSLPCVEFCSYKFVEIQGLQEDIIVDKLDQFAHITSEVIMVDDTSLELVALDGFPGPYVRPFFSQTPIAKLGDKLEKLGSNDAYVVHTVAVQFKTYRTIQVVRFPVIWGVPMSQGHDFDPYCYYQGKPLTEHGGWFRKVISFWIKVILTRHIYDPSMRKEFDQD